MIAYDTRYIYENFLFLDSPLDVSVLLYGHKSNYSPENKKLQVCFPENKSFRYDFKI